MKIELNISKKHLYILTALVIVFAGLIFVLAAVDKTKGWHSSNDVEVTIGTTAYSLQDAISQGKIGGENFMDKIQTGIIGTCASGSATSSGTVNFPVAFSAIPIIILSVSEEGSNSGCTSARITARSASSFSWNSWVGSSGVACDCIYWMAIEP